jgi:hypothetical protein
VRLGPNCGCVGWPVAWLRTAGRAHTQTCDSIFYWSCHSTRDKSHARTRIFRQVPQTFTFQQPDVAGVHKGGTAGRRLEFIEGPRAIVPVKEVHSLSVRPRPVAPAPQEKRWPSGEEAQDGEVWQPLAVPPPTPSPPIPVGDAASSSSSAGTSLPYGTAGARPPSGVESVE